MKQQRMQWFLHCFLFWQMIVTEYFGIMLALILIDKGALCMTLHHDYDKDRLKKNQKNHFLGSAGGLALMYAITIILSSLVNCWVAGTLGGAYDFFQDPVTKAGIRALSLGDPNATFGNEFTQNLTLANIGNFTVAKHYWKIFLVLEIAFILASTRLIMKIHIRWRPRKTNQYGNDRLTSEPEILRQYPIIPDRDFTFPGYGGIPVMHFQPWSILIKYHPILFLRRYLQPRFTKIKQYCQGFFAIDQTTVNSLGIGITRSGKDQSVITPLVDIISRAAKKCSMVLTDPKIETLALAYLPLKKRGYDIEVINVSDTNRSMSYNPLQIIVNFAKDGYYDETQQAVNSLSTSIYADPNAKDKFWQESSINLLNSLILALIDHADRNHNWQEVTMDNVIHMMTELGGKEVYINKFGEIIPEEGDADLPDVDDTKAVAAKNKLLMYFTKLRKLQDAKFSKWRQMALDAFAQSKFSGDETTGNIYSSAIGPIKIYLQSNIAQLTSMNTVDFEKIGFPRMLKLTFPKTYRFSTVKVKITDLQNNTIEQHTSSVDKLGKVKYTVRKKLPDDFSIYLSFKFHRNDPAIQQDWINLRGHKVFWKKGLETGNYKLDPYTNQPILKKVTLTTIDSHLNGELKQMQLKYSEKPVALFLVTPPDNPSYNQLLAFAVDQIFNTLWSLAERNGRKLVTRLHFILNEFGNVPTINAMETKISIGLSAGMLFNIFVQNLEQLEIHYSKHVAETIKSNCSNWLYILTNSWQTAQQISNLAGKRTVDVTTNNGKLGDARNTNVNNSYISQNIFSPTELTNFMGGEMLTLRATYRQDQKKQSVVAYPIFAHGKTKLPFSYTFLADEFNDQRTIDDIGIKAPHRNLKLEELRVNYDKAYRQLLDLIDGQESDDISDLHSELNIAMGGSGENLDDNTETNSHQENNDIIFDNTLLNDHQFLADINQVVFEFLDKIHPSQQLRLQMFNHTYDFWRDDNHNRWSYLQNELFSDRPDLYQDLAAVMQQRINQLKKG